MPERQHTMDLLPLVCLCLLTWSAGTAADHKPVVVEVEPGRDVILPCSLGHQKSVTFKYFEWKKDGQKDVFFYDAGRHYNNDNTGQDEQFKGRVSHFSDQLKNGTASIKIRDTKISDSGNYTCDFPRLQPPQTFYIKLVVEPVVVKVEQGSDVILPCSLSPQKSITYEHFEWKKDDQKKVFYYDGGIHSNKEDTGQDEQFKGRVFHFSDQLKNGNASIMISNTQNDTGIYTCDFPHLQPRQTFYIKLFIVDPTLRNRYPGVKGAAPKPFIKLVKTDDGVQLQCEVEGASPQPEVEWKDSAGNILPAKEPQVTERGGSCDVILQATVTKADTFTCVVTQKEINHQISADTYALNGAAPEPFIKLVKTDDGVVLQCAVRDVSPQPKVEWKDSAGNILPAKEPQVTERGGSYNVILQATVTKADTFTCVVTQNDINHQISAKTYAAPLNEAKPKTTDSTGLVVGVSVPIILLVVGVVLVQTEL